MSDLASLPLSIRQLVEKLRRHANWLRAEGESADAAWGPPDTDDDGRNLRAWGDVIDQAADLLAGVVPPPSLEQKADAVAAFMASELKRVGYVRDDDSVTPADEAKLKSILAQIVAGVVPPREQHHEEENAGQSGPEKPESEEARSRSPQPCELTPEVERRLRAYLCFSHGHTGQYGDDGELQCGACVPFGAWDYRRTSIGELLNVLDKVGMDRILRKASSVRPHAPDTTVPSGGSRP